MIRFRPPGKEPLAALLASSGWLLGWAAVSALACSWWWLVLGAGLLLIAAGGLLWYDQRLDAEILVESEAARTGPRRAAG